MSAPDLAAATALLVDAVHIWRVTPGSVGEVIDAATECLVVGVDSPLLRELAGVSPNGSPFALKQLIEDTMDELGLGGAMAVEPERGALVAMARRFQTGTISASELVRWAHTNIGHEGDREWQVFVNLAEGMDDTAYFVDDPVELERRTAEAVAAVLRRQ